MSTKDKISVIIPTYNREKIIVKSIESVINQSYNNLEIIVVDDCSTDNTEKEIQNIKDDRIKYIKLEKNRGACYARNIGIKASTGKYIAFQDSDDIFGKEKLKKQLKNLKINNSDLDFCKLKVHTNDKIILFPGVQQEKNINKGKILEELCKNNIISTQAIIAKREIFNNELFDEKLPRLQDYDIVLRIATKYKISYTPTVLCEVLQQEDSISKSNEKLFKACKIMLKKNYSLNKSNQKKLTKTLMFLASSDRYQELSEAYSTLCIEYGKLNDRYQELSKKKETYNKYDELLEKYKDLEKKHNNIINSKRWKTLCKIMKIIGK